LKGRDLVITFRISATSTAQGVEGASSPVSSTFGSEEDTVSSFRFLEIVAFGPGADFVFFKKNSSSFTNRAACLFRMLTIPFSFHPFGPFVKPLVIRVFKV
jgi:hypothetical protein